MDCPAVVMVGEDRPSTSFHSVISEVVDGGPSPAMTGEIKMIVPTAHLALAAAIAACVQPEPVSNQIAPTIELGFAWLGQLEIAGLDLAGGLVVRHDHPGRIGL
jgi:hypothetical protein